MPPKKKKENICITKCSDSVLNSEWIPGSEMVFETPDTNLISKSRRATQRFIRSLQSFEKEDFAQIPDKFTQPLISTSGMKTRLRRHSLIVDKSIPNVSFANSSKKASSMFQTSCLKRLSSSKLITVNKFSDSVLKMSSSKTTTTFDPSPTTRTMKRNQKAENSSNHTKVLNKDNAANLLDTDEISAIIVNLRDKRKSDISIIDTEEKTKLIKLSIHSAETNPIKRRSFRIANMERDETVAEDNTSKDKILNKRFQKTKVKKIKNESFAENSSKHRMLNKKDCIKRAKIQKKTGAKSPIAVREKYKEKIVKEVDPNRIVPKQMHKSRKSSIKRQSAKREKDEGEVYAETKEKESPAKYRTSKRQSIRNCKDSDDPNNGVKMSKSLKEMSGKESDVMDKQTKEENVKEVDPNRIVPKQKPKSRKSSIKRQSAKREKDEGEVYAETKEKESPAKYRTSKRQSIRNNNVEWRKEKIVVDKRTSQKVTCKSGEVEKDIECKIISEKMKNSSTNAIILTNECPKSNTCDMIMSEQKLNENNVKKYADKLSIAIQNYYTVKEENTEKLMYEQVKEVQEKVMLDKTITRNVTKQVASTMRKEKEGNLKTVDEKTLRVKVDKTSSPKMKVTKFDSQCVIEAQNISRLSSKSRKSKKHISYRKSRKNNFSLHKVVLDKIDKKMIASKNASSKDSKSTQRKQRDISLKKINENVIVIDEDETITCKEKKTTDDRLSAKGDSEKKPLKLISVDILTEKIGNLVPKNTTKNQNSIEENVESCKSVNWSLNSLFNSFLVGKGQAAELVSKEGETNKPANQKVEAVSEMFANRMRGKLPSEKTEQFSLPLLSSTPDIAKQPQINVKTSFASKLHKTVSNLSPFSIQKSFEYTRTSIDTSSNQTLEEAVCVQKVEHNKLKNKKKNEIEDDEVKMKVNADFESKEVKESSNHLLEKRIHYESQESDIEKEKPDPNVINDDSSMLDSTDATAPAKFMYYESLQSDEEMSVIEKNVFCESEVDINKDVYKSHLSEKSDLFAVPKIIHYESQQSEMEDEACNMSQAGLEEIPEDMSHEVKECKDVLQEMNEKVPNILEQDMMISDYIKCQYQPQQLEIEDNFIGKTLHYESQQSETSVSKIMEDFKISKDEEEEKLDDIAIDYDVSYSNYGLKCIIL